MEVNSERPTDEPIVEDGATQEPTTAGQVDAVKPDVEEEVTLPVEDDDTKPLTVDEVIDAGRQVAQTAKHAVLRPLYRLGRNYIRSARKASESFFDGVTGEKRDK